MEIPDIDKQMLCIAYLKKEQINLIELENYLKTQFEKDNDILKNSKPSTRTNLRRLIRIYDYLKGESKKASVDRGINFVVATYDSKHKSGFVSGKAIKQKRANYSKLRKELQMRHTPSSRRRLKAIGQRENRWMQDINHQVSKALVENNPKHTLFVLEDLSGIRNTTERVKTKDRYVSVSWSFYDLEQKLIYKAKQNQSSVIKVDPHYTSQCCPCCGHVEKSNRNKKIHLFTCQKCGYKSNDDRIGAMNLYRMGINYLADSQVPNTVVTE